MCCNKEDRPVRVTGYLSILAIGVMLDIAFPTRNTQMLRWNATLVGPN